MVTPVRFFSLFHLLTQYSTGNRLPFRIPHPHRPINATPASELLAWDTSPSSTELCTEIDYLQSDVQGLDHRVEDIEIFVEGIQKERAIDIGLIAELEKEWNGAYMMLNTTTNHGLARLDRQITGIRSEMLIVNKESATSTSRLAGVDNWATNQQKESECLEQIITQQKAMGTQTWQQLRDTVEKQSERIRVLEGTVAGQRNLIARMDQCYQMVAERLQRLEDHAAAVQEMTTEVSEPRDSKESSPANQNAAPTLEHESDAVPDTMDFLDEEMRNQDEDADHEMETSEETPQDIGDDTKSVQVQVIPPTPTGPVVGQRPSPTPNDGPIPLPTIAEDIDAATSEANPLVVPPMYERRRSPRLITGHSVPAPVAPAHTRRRNTVNSRSSRSPRPTTPPSASLVVHGSPDERVDFEGSP